MGVGVACDMWLCGSILGYKTGQLFGCVCGVDMCAYRCKENDMGEKLKPLTRKKEELGFLVSPLTF